MCWKSYANGSNIVALRLGDHATKEMLGVVDWEVWPVSDFAQQRPTTCNRVCKRTQHVTSNNVASVCTYNGGQKNLGLCEKPFQEIVTKDPAPKDNFLFGFGFIPPPPSPTTSPSNVVAEKSTDSHPFCSKFNFVWGGRGGVTSFSNIPKGPNTFDLHCSQSRRQETLI